jgi:hypothetical protein
MPWQTALQLAVQMQRSCCIGLDLQQQQQQQQQEKWGKQENSSTISSMPRVSSQPPVAL